ncbi:hypothetical protein T484DRAFT_1830167 [Baffinella frigidus]|nr:hypothetical protein T484DRAFT_1830167 [Cryptophyta sp. CCMP2293]
MQDRGDEAAEAGPPAAKRARNTHPSRMNTEALQKELRQRGLGTEGKWVVLAARLKESLEKGDNLQEQGPQEQGCWWRGTVGQLDAHLEGCDWMPVKCPNKGCTESPLRKDLPDHTTTCGKCQHCEWQIDCQSLAKHEGRCPAVKIECPNAGCGVQYVRGSMNLHRAECEREEVACPCKACDSRLLRQDVDAHVSAQHLQAAVLKRVLSRIAALEGREESEQRLAAASPTSWVFNWPAGGWGMGEFESETRDFGAGVTGRCVLMVTEDPRHSHFLGYRIEGRDKCFSHVTFSILDKHDKILRTVFEAGSAAAPAEDIFTASSRFLGARFTPTAEEKEKSDGSVRLHAVVRLFLDHKEKGVRGEARRGGGVGEGGAAAEPRRGRENRKQVNRSDFISENEF